MTAMEKTVREIVELVAKGDYQAVEKRSGGVRMSADDLREAVEDWGMELAPPPTDGWWERATVTPIDDTDPPEFHVAAPMWQPDGESDISLELTLRQVSEDEFEVEVDNLHML